MAADRGCAIGVATLARQTIAAKTLHPAHGSTEIIVILWWIEAISCQNDVFWVATLALRESEEQGFVLREMIEDTSQKARA